MCPFHGCVNIIHSITVIQLMLLIERHKHIHKNKQTHTHTHTRLHSYSLHNTLICGVHFVLSYPSVYPQGRFILFSTPHKFDRGKPSIVLYCFMYPARYAFVKPQTNKYTKLTSTVVTLCTWPVIRCIIIYIFFS